MMKVKRLGLALLLLAGAAGTAQAQRRPPEIEHAAVLFIAQPCPAVILPSSHCFQNQDSAGLEWLGARAPDHRYEGLAIGAGLGALLGVLGGLVACEQTEDTNASCTRYAIVGGLGIAALGGLTGLLIGAQFPKEPGEPAPRDSVVQ
jgi:hypothetical protein